MKTLLITFALLACTHGLNHPIDEDSSSGRSRLVSLSRPVQDTCSSPFSCYNCTAAQICAPDPSTGAWSVVERVSCPSEDTPYCSSATGTCSATPDDDCGEQDKFICQSNGKFPDPDDCATYHVCNNYKSTAFECVPGFNYDPDQQSCSRSAPCNRVNCTLKSGVKLQMANSHYFAYCAAGNPLIMNRCPGNYKLNSTSQECEAICEKDGPMVDNKDCTMFYMCSTWVINPTLSVPIRDHLACPQGEAFDPDYLMCVDIKNTDCVKPTPPPPTTLPPTTRAPTTAPTTNPTTKKVVKKFARI